MQEISDTSNFNETTHALQPKKGLSNGQQFSKVAIAMATCVDVLKGLSISDRNAVVNGLAGMVNLTTISKFAGSVVTTESKRKAESSIKTDASTVSKKQTQKESKTPSAPEKVQSSSRNKRPGSPKQSSKKKTKVNPPVPNPANKDPKVIDLKRQLAEVRSAIKEKAKLSQPTVDNPKLEASDDLVVKQNSILAGITLAKCSFRGFKNLEITEKGRECGADSAQQSCDWADYPMDDSPGSPQPLA